MRKPLVFIFCLLAIILQAQDNLVEIPVYRITNNPISELKYDGLHTLWMQFNGNPHQCSGRELHIFPKKSPDSDPLHFIYATSQLYYFHTENAVYAYDLVNEVFHKLPLKYTTPIEFVTIQNELLLCQQSGFFSIYKLHEHTAVLSSSKILPAINDIYLANTNEFWIATNEGLRILMNGELKSIPELFFLFQTPIRKILSDTYNQIWFITSNNVLFRYNGNRLIKVEDPNHIILEKIIDACIQENRLWMIDKNSGLLSYRLDNGTWTSHVTNDSTLLIGYTQLKADKFNHLFLAGPRGLLRTDLSSNPAFPQITLEDIQVLFTSLLKDSSALKDGNTLNIDHSLKPDENYLSFRFSAGNLENDAVQYQYLLDGFNNDWSPWNFETTVNYSALPPGNYKFRVRASANGLVSETSSGIFTIESPFWTADRIKSLTIFTSIVCALLIITFVLRNQRKRLQKIKLDLELREASLSWQQKALQLQLNPHFIFNAINSIKGLIARSDNKEARQQLQNFANFLRGMLDMSRSESIPVISEIEFLEKYLQLEQMMQSTPFAYTIAISPDLKALNPSIPPMMIQIFLENAIKHGFNKIDYTGILNIEFDTYGQNIRCTIRDNGIGRFRASELSKSHNSQGISVIRDRLKVLAPESKTDRIKITDLKNENGDVQGTMVVLILPLMQVIN